ncbi:MAG TPA: Yae1 family protein [Plasticicumulans sp.]|nr:Yae1 family protein [Plasticicumulans sp.]
MPRLPTLEEIEAIERAAREEGYAAGRAEGRAKGYAEGHAEGRDAGFVEGRAAGYADGSVAGRETGYAGIGLRQDRAIYRKLGGSTVAGNRKSIFAFGKTAATV